MVMTMRSFISAFLLSSACAVPLDAKNSCGVHWVYNSLVYPGGNTVVEAHLKGSDGNTVVVLEEYVS
jgi:hypothetical protein